MKWSEVDNRYEYVLAHHDYAVHVVDYLVEAVKSVKNLHSEMTHSYGKVACRECGQAYPCQTIRVIDNADLKAETVETRIQTLIEEYRSDKSSDRNFPSMKAAFKRIADELENALGGNKK